MINISEDLFGITKFMLMLKIKNILLIISGDVDLITCGILTEFAFKSATLDSIK